MTAIDLQHYSYPLSSITLNRSNPVLQHFLLTYLDSLLKTVCFFDSLVRRRFDSVVSSAVQSVTGIMNVRYYHMEAQE